MQKPAFAREHAALAGLFVGLVALFAVIATLPVMPIDETRYLTVAWEMRATGSWSLPTLNFEPYSHKPPLLFWLINMFWSVFGEGVWPARLVGFLNMVVVLVLTHRLDRDLARAGSSPARDLAETSAVRPAASALLLLGLPVFVGMGFAIMFDMLLTATVMGGLLALWHAGRTAGWKTWSLYGLCVGLGLLAKGPIVLVFLLPPALLGGFWASKSQRSGWYLRLLAAFALGIAIGLAWAVRAAVLGGPDYAEMLFWKQSAGRVAASFAHARPFWFYFPILLVFLSPVIFWRPSRAAIWTWVHKPDEVRNFLLSWLIPPFVILSLISGKQIHYMLPLVPGIAILISLGLRQVPFLPSDRRSVVYLGGGFALFLIAAWMIGPSLIKSEGTLAALATALGSPWFLATVAASLTPLLIFNRSASEILVGIALANLIFIACITVQVRRTVAEFYDLQPVANVIAHVRDRPIASDGKVKGEYGFLARLTHPIVDISDDTVACWLQRNPGSAAILRNRRNSRRLSIENPAYRTIYEQPYRDNETIRVVQGTGSAVCAPLP